MYYKPESLEENFSNVLKLRDNFMNNIKSYMWEYDWICRVYTDANTYNFYLRNYMIKETFIKAIMKECTAHRVSLSSQSLSW